MRVARRARSEWTPTGKPGYLKDQRSSPSDTALFFLFFFIAINALLHPDYCFANEPKTEDKEQNIKNQIFPSTSNLSVCITQAAYSSLGVHILSIDLSRVAWNWMNKWKRQRKISDEAGGCSGLVVNRLEFESGMRFKRRLIASCNWHCWFYWIFTGWKYFLVNRVLLFEIGARVVTFLHI